MLRENFTNFIYILQLAKWKDSSCNLYLHTLLQLHSDKMFTSLKEKVDLKMMHQNNNKNHIVLWYKSWPRVKCRANNMKVGGLDNN